VGCRHPDEEWEVIGMATTRQGTRSPVRLLPVLAVATAVSCSGAAGSEDGEASSSAVEGAERGVVIESPSDNAEVAAPVAFEVQATGGLTLAPASSDDPDTGHAHLVIDHECIGVGGTIPEAEWVVHLDDGSTSVEVALEAGVHEICAQVGDASHAAVYAVDEILVTVTG
jgi:hypothetical protein